MVISVVNAAQMTQIVKEWLQFTQKLHTKDLCANGAQWTPI